MHALLTDPGRLAAWAFYFATAVTGHVALKLAADGSTAGTRGAAAALLRPWGLVAGAAWALSAVAWVLVLQRDSLSRANAISSARYVLVLAAAWALLGERMTAREWAGAALIGAGLVVLGRGA